MTIPALNQTPVFSSSPAPLEPHARLREVAQELEEAFLSEMLKHAGFDEARESFGGGIGEEQMTSLLRNEHAHALSARGGIGLSEQIFQSLLRREGGGQ